MHNQVILKCITHTEIEGYTLGSIYVNAKIPSFRDERQNVLKLKIDVTFSKREGTIRPKFYTGFKPGFMTVFLIKY